MPSGKIFTLYSNKERNEELYPVTALTAVTDDNDTSLEALLDEKVSISTTINGYPLTGDIEFGASQCGAVSYYAKQTFTDVQKANVLHNVGWEQGDMSSTNIKDNAYIQNKTSGPVEKIEKIDTIIYYKDLETYTFVSNGGPRFDTHPTPIILPEDGLYRLVFSIQGREQDQVEQVFTQNSINCTFTSHEYYCRFNLKGGQYLEAMNENIPNSLTLTILVQQPIYEKKDTIIVSEEPIDIKYLPIPNYQYDNEIQNFSKCFGKQVYVSAIDCGTVPAKTKKTIQVSDKDIIIIKVDASVIKNDGTDSYSLPYMDPNISVTDLLLGQLEILFALSENNSLIIKSTYTQNNYNVYALVYYIYK